MLMKLPYDIQDNIVLPATHHISDLIPLISIDIKFCEEIYQNLLDDSFCYKDSLILSHKNIYITSNKEEFYYYDKDADILCPLFFFREPDNNNHRFRICKKRNTIELFNIYKAREKGRFDLLYTKLSPILRKEMENILLNKGIKF